MRVVAVLLALNLPGQTPPSRARTDRVSGNGEPVEMTAKGGLEIDLERRVGVAQGDVTIRRRDVVVCCDRAEARYFGNRVQRVECRGRVVIVRPDGTRARADVAVFDASKDRITLTGRAKVRADQADLEGDVIVYDIAADRLDVRGNFERSRLRFLPNDAPPLRLGRKCPADP